MSFPKRERRQTLGANWARSYGLHHSVPRTWCSSRLPSVNIYLLTLTVFSFFYKQYFFQSLATSGRGTVAKITQQKSHYSNCRILFWHFSAIFVLLKLTPRYWFSKTRQKFKIFATFNEFLDFARNVD